MRSDRRALVSLLVPVVLLATVVGASVITSRDEPSTVVAPPAPSDAVDAGRTDAWKPGVLAAENGLAQLFVQPDPARLPEYVSPECACYSDIESRLTNLQRSKQHYAAPLVEYGDVRLLDSGPNRVKVQLQVKYSAVPLLDAQGRTVRTSEALEGFTVDTLVRAADGRWRLSERSVPPADAVLGAIAS